MRLSRAALLILSLNVSIAPLRASKVPPREPKAREPTAYESAKSDLSPEQLLARDAMLQGLTTKKEVEIVMAHYDEDVTWAVEWADFVTLYTHGARRTMDALFPRARIKTLHPNVGKESHAYLWHIIHNYDDLANWTVFTQAGRPAQGYTGGGGGTGDDTHAGGHLVAGSTFADYVLAYASDVPHYFVASSAVEPATLDHVLRVDFTTEPSREQPGERGAWGLEDRCPHPAGTAAANSSPRWMPLWLEMDRNAFEPLVAQREQCGSSCPSLIEFAENLDIPGTFQEGTPVVFAQGARFAVSRDRLLRHPKSYYENLFEQVGHHTDPWQGYFFEYLWFHMLAAEDDADRMCAETPTYRKAQPIDAVHRYLRGMSTDGVSSISGISSRTDGERGPSSRWCRHSLVDC